MTLRIAATFGPSSTLPTWIQFYFLFLLCHEI
jgi:hypothetical protein